MSRESILPAYPVAGSRIITDYGRVTDDWYVEPRWVTRQLLERIEFVGAIHDPCCGEGNILEICRIMGYEVSGADVVDRGAEGLVVDFFQDTKQYENCICNPPYKTAEKFILQGLQLTRCRFAAFVNLKFLASQGRRDRLFNPHPPAWVLICSERPSVPPGGMGIEAKGGTADYCWIVWDKNEQDQFTKIGWLG